MGIDFIHSIHECKKNGTSKNINLLYFTCFYYSAYHHASVPMTRLNSKTANLKPRTTSKKTEMTLLTNCPRGCNGKILNYNGGLFYFSTNFLEWWPTGAGRQRSVRNWDLAGPLDTHVGCPRSKSHVQEIYYTYQTWVVCNIHETTAPRSDHQVYYQNTESLKTSDFPPSKF